MTSQDRKYDPFPSLDEVFARRVQEGLYERFGKEAPQIAWDDWIKLKPCLAEYKHEAEDIRGYLNKGEAKLLRDISKRVNAMLSAIDRAKSSGLLAPIAAAVEPVSIEEFQSLLFRIEEELRLEGKITPDFPDARANLFSNFERWWMRTTGQQGKIEEGWTGDTHPTPFMFVANEVFNIRGITFAIGASFKPLKDMKRAARKQLQAEKDFAEKLKTLAEKLKRTFPSS